MTFVDIVLYETIYKQNLKVINVYYNIRYHRSFHAGMYRKCWEFYEGIFK